MTSSAIHWGRADLLAALSCFVMGFLFIRMVFYPGEGWGATLYTLLYISLVLGYVRVRDIKPSNESWFWAAVLATIAAGFALWEGGSIKELRLLLLIAVAIYWVLVVTRTTSSGGTSDWLPVDVLKGMLKLPFSRLHLQYGCINSFLKGRSELRSKVLLGLSGVLLAGLFILLAWPFLIMADAGGFQDLLRELNIYPMELPVFDETLLLQILLSFPVAAYMFALLANSIYQPFEGHGGDKASQWQEKLRIVPGTTVYTALIILNIFYVIFFVTQMPYYLSAFRGLIPEGWESYAEFARRGFFELIAISALNLIFIAFSSICVNRAGQESALYKLLVSLLSAGTIFFTAAAAARLVLYIEIFALTIMRVLPAVFMIFLTIIAVGIIIKQLKRISIMRLAAFTGALLICLLFTVNIDGLIAAYNAKRYIEGTIEEFDTIVLWRAGIAGIPAALRVLEETEDPRLRYEISRQYIQSSEWQLSSTEGTMRDTLQHELSRRMLEEYR